MRRIPRLVRAVLLTGGVALGASCDQATEPTAPPSGLAIPVVETFSGTLQPSGEAFYSFAMSRTGTISLTLLAMTGPSIAADALFPIGIGSPAGTTCLAGIDAAASPGGSPQFTTAKNAGVYCVRISDGNGHLGAPATFALNITHPR